MNLAFLLVKEQTTGMITCLSTDRVAIITGSNKGIGYFIALQLGLSGLFQHILLACRDPHRASAAVESLRAALPSTVQVHSESLELGNHNSHRQFAKKVEENFGKVDCLVNNAAFAFKNSDPTPFKKQCKPTLDVNFRGTVDFTEQMLPLMRKGSDPRIVNVASMAGHLSQVSAEHQNVLTSESITMPQLLAFMDDFEKAVQEGTHLQKGYSNSNYGMSKLALIAATKIWAREEAANGISVNACCPGYCKTDMTSQHGLRDPADGAKNAVIPATMDNPPTGEFFSNYQVSRW